MFWKHASGLQSNHCFLCFPPQEARDRSRAGEYRLCPHHLQAQGSRSPLLSPGAWRLAWPVFHAFLTAPWGLSRFHPGRARLGPVGSRVCGVAGALSVEGAGWGRHRALGGDERGRMRWAGPPGQMSVILMAPRFVCVCLQAPLREHEPSGDQPSASSDLVSGVISRTTPVPCPFSPKSGYIPFLVSPPGSWRVD